MKLSLVPFDFEYHVPFQISREKRTHQEALFVALEYDGLTGWGEITTNSYYKVLRSNVVKLLEANRASIEKISIDHPQNLYAEWLNLFPEDPFIRCALDTACWDLYGKYKGKRTTELLSLSDVNDKVSCFTVGIGSNTQTLDSIIKNPWPIYKLKMGVQQNFELLDEIREVTNSDLYIDANAAWSLEDSLTGIPKIAQRGVHLIEQPLSVEDNAQMKDLKGRFNTPIIADESFNDHSDLSLCVDCFDGINVKLQKIGGLTPAVDVIKKAKTQNLKIMIGCMTESSVGLSAAAQLVNLSDYIDLDSMLLINNDPALGVKLEPKTITLSKLYGNGVVVDF